MAVIRTEAPTSAPPQIVWALVRDLSERLRFLPAEAFRGAEGDRDHARFQVRVVRGWAEAESHVVREVEGRLVEEQASAQGLDYTATFEVDDGAIRAMVDYRLAGLPGLVERTLVRPMIERSFAQQVQALAAEADRRAAAAT
jgi:hypothetical protein